MRQECKHFQSRTYPTGDTMRKCALDLAPEAPWACPTDCPSFEPRMADVGWKHGSLAAGPTPDQPPGLGQDDAIASLLDEAEDIINQAGPQIKAEVDRERKSSRRPSWWPFGRGR